MALVHKHGCDWIAGCTEPGARPVSIKLGTITYLCHEHHDQLCELIRFAAAPDRWQSTIKDKELGF